MASTLKINTLTGVTTAGSIAVTGEGNSTTTNLQQGLLKFWLQADSSASVRDSLNNSGSTDNGTGDYSYTFTNNMGNANYSLFGSGNSLAGNTGVCITNSNANNENSASLCRFIYTAGNGADTADDPGYAYYQVAGDLA